MLQVTNTTVSSFTGLSLEETTANFETAVKEFATRLMLFTGAEPAEQRDNYENDAREIFASHPHLTGLGAMIDQWHTAPKETRVDYTVNS